MTDADRVWNVVTCILIVAGVPLLAWIRYSLAADTFAPWTRGIEKRVSVIRCPLADDLATAKVFFAIETAAV